jgi:hypothetical protein
MATKLCRYVALPIGMIPTKFYFIQVKNKGIGRIQKIYENGRVAGKIVKFAGGRPNSVCGLLWA